MPTFIFEALNDAGKPEKGEIVAANDEEAAARIRSKGFFPTSVREQRVAPRSAARTGAHRPAKKKLDLANITIGGVSQKMLTTFTRQMSTLQDAGLPILRSLAILEQQQRPGMLKKVLQGVQEDVSGGSTLSDAMAKHPKAFDVLYTKMIAAGEVGGVLDLILQRLAEFMEKAARLKRRIIGAMIYPAVVISVAVIIVTLIMIYIVPKFQSIFEDFAFELPKMTTALMALSYWIGGNNPGQLIPGWVFMIFTVPVIYVAIKLIRKTAMGKAFLDRVFLFIPIAGKLGAKATIARFTRTLGTLINAGVPILDALIITRDTTGNDVYRKALTSVHDSVRQGDSFAEPLRRARVCDAIVVNMIDVGEETGDLDKMLEKIADNYDEEVDVMVAGMVSLLEPIMVVLLGGIVGFIVIALFLPLVHLIENLSG